MTAATVRRNIKIARKSLVAEYGMARSAHVKAMVNEIHRLSAYCGDAYTYGLLDELDAVCAELRREIAWLNECSAARNVVAPAKLTGFAAECALASAMYHAG